ncbi:hypothetical protein TRIUR3_12163 [Triticum urartu]|uniref:Uncharacterized protein n=1 Tax=Triticum urartu TaxID=4572 RepID=M7ZN70_TRIUA|nr:hypothetical protein TRIUR3_12163 [Triticum urartu]
MERWPPDLLHVGFYQRALPHPRRSSPGCRSRKRTPSHTMVARDFPDLDPPSPPAGTAFTARIRRSLDLPPRFPVTPVRRFRAET